MLIAWALCALAQAESKLKVEAVALSLVREGGSENEAGPFNQNDPGTKIALRVSSPELGILALDHRKSKLVSMKDDAGSDLLAVKPKKDSVFSRAGIGSFPRVAKDGSSCLVEVQAHGLPSKGARAIRLEGTLALVTARGRESVKREDVALQAGAKIQAGPLELAVQKTGKNAFDEEHPFQVTFSGGKGGRSLAKLRFLDAAGKEIASKAGGVSRMSGFGEESWSWDYALKSELKACAIEVELWKDLNEVALPFALEVSLGL